MSESLPVSRLHELYRVISWLWHRSRCPICLAAGAAITIPCEVMETLQRWSVQG